MNSKLRYFELCPELTDGQHRTVTDSIPEILSMVEAWLTDATEGEEMSIKAVMMTQEEVEALPDI